MRRRSAARRRETYRDRFKGDSSVVTWAMHGPSPFMSKVMSVFISMDKVLGKDFEAGLASMKAAAET